MGFRFNNKKLSLENVNSNDNNSYAVDDAATTNTLAKEPY